MEAKASSRVGVYQAIFCGVVAIGFVLMALEARTFNDLASWFPFYTALAGLVVALVALGASLRAAHRERTTDDGGTTAEDSDATIFLRGLQWLLLITAVVLLARLVGFVLAAPIWIILWFTVIYRWRKRNIAIAVVVVMAIIYLLASVAGVETPDGVF